MTLFSFSLAGSVAALIAMTICFVWLYRRGKFRTSRMDGDEAIDFVQDRVVDRQRRGVLAKDFKGKGWGTGMAAEIETREVLEMVRLGRYAEAGPWLCGVFGALGAFLFWPMWIMELCDADPILKLGKGFLEQGFKRRKFGLRKTGVVRRATVGRLQPPVAQRLRPPVLKRRSHLLSLDSWAIFDDFR
jgi:hypothetical protein